MRIASLVLGTRGDLEIALQLAAALAARGHELTVASSSFYAERVAKAGHAFAPVGDGKLEELLDVFHSLSRVSDRSERNRAYADRWLRPQLSASRGLIARLLADFDAGFNNLRLFDRSAGARPTALVTYDPPSDPQRYGAAESPPHVLELVALDRDLVDRRRVWPDPFHFTGFFTPSYAGADPPAEEAERLDTFLTAGEPVVVLTMGSMACFDAEAVRSKLLAACRLAGRRLLTIASWAGLDNTDDADSLTVRQAPYDRVFSSAACVAHHGGCGTVISVLRAGKPSILLPQITSQATFARLLAEQHLAAAAFEVEALDPAALAEAIVRATDDPAIQRACASWRDRLLTPDGAEAAAEKFERHAERFGGKG